MLCIVAFVRNEWLDARLHHIIFNVNLTTLKLSVSKYTFTEKCYLDSNRNNIQKPQKVKLVVNNSARFV